MKLKKIPVSLLYRCYIPNLVKNDTVFLKKMLTHDRRQPIAIGHLSYSGDLKISNEYPPSIGYHCTKFNTVSIKQRGHKILSDNTSDKDVASFETRKQMGQKIPSGQHL